MLQLITSSFLMVFLAEMADKTQFLVVGLSAKCRFKQLVIGVVLSAVLLNLFAVFLGSAVASLIPVDIVKIVAGAAFLFFSLWTFLDAGKIQQTKESAARMCSVPGITLAFFLAELGDKTQLGTLSLAAANPDAIIGVFLGCTLGLLSADGVGIVFGILLGKSLPEKLLKYLSGGIFFLFSLSTLYAPLKTFCGGFVVWILATVCVITILILILFAKKKRK